LDRARLRELMERVRAGELATDSALEALAQLPFVELPSARVDTHRALRSGLPEVIYAPGKSAEQIADIARTLHRAGQSVLATRVSADVAIALRAMLSEGTYEAAARLFWLGPSEVPVIGGGTIAVVSAGTADHPVSMEAAGVARRFGNRVDLIEDVGVAGVHRLLAVGDRLRAARVLIVVAGMEGALPSVVGGLVDKPVIAVPTSVGYGASYGGLAALLGMLTSCASNVSVVNIDNGFGAAHVATLINRL
jgi:NCAIR mutase (PurE)-related protein